MSTKLFVRANPRPQDLANNRVSGAQWYVKIPKELQREGLNHNNYHHTSDLDGGHIGYADRPLNLEVTGELPEGTPVLVGYGAGHLERVVTQVSRLEVQPLTKAIEARHQLLKEAVGRAETILETAESVLHYYVLHAEQIAANISPEAKPELAEKGKFEQRITEAEHRLDIYRKVLEAPFALPWQVRDSIGQEVELIHAIPCADEPLSIEVPFAPGKKLFVGFSGADFQEVTTV